MWYEKICCDAEYILSYSDLTVAVSARLSLHLPDSLHAASSALAETALGSLLLPVALLPYLLST